MFFLPEFSIVSQEAPGEVASSLCPFDHKNILRFHWPEEGLYPQGLKEV